MGDEDVRKRLDKAYSVAGPEGLEKLYAEWAVDYDSDLSEVFGYASPALVANALATALTDMPAATVLDIGCGTGLAGVSLRHHGAWLMDGTDFSTAMLEQAGSKNLYQSLFVADVIKRIPAENGAYGAAMSSGLFTHGHVGADVLPECLRVLAPGAPFSLTVNAAFWDEGGFEAAIPALEAAGLATLAAKHHASHFDREENAGSFILTLVKR